VHEVYDPEVSDLETLLQNADVALCEVKGSGRGAFQIFDAKMGRRRDDQANVAMDIARGLAFDEFQVFFQPMIEISTGTVTGLELLARWQHPDHGLLTPDAFLNAAEAYKLLDELGVQVLERGCSAVRKLRASGLIIPTLHLNLSRSQVLSSNMIDQMHWLIDSIALAPKSLAIEVTEASCVGRGADLVIGNLARLRKHGHPTVIDAFGKQIGAMRILSNTHAAQIKLSRSVLEDGEGSPITEENQALVRATLSVGKSLGVSVVAKGVETAEQIAAMRALGVTEMQGNGIAEAMAPPDLARWLAGRAIAGDGSSEARIAQSRRA